jgi:aspartate/glutamate racemase
MNKPDQVIGLLGGLGVGAAIHYYRKLADASTGDRQGLAAYFAGLLGRLKSVGVVPAVDPFPHVDCAQAHINAILAAAQAGAHAHR